MKREKEAYHTDVVDTVVLLPHARQDSRHHFLRGTDGFSGRGGRLEDEERVEGNDDGPAVLYRVRRRRRRHWEE